MRRRLLLVLSVLSLLAVAGFAFPLLSSTAATRTQQFVLSRSADLDQFAAYAQLATAPEGIATLLDEVNAHTRLYGEGVVVVDAAGRPLVESGISTDDPGVAGAVEAALRNQPAPLPQTLLPWTSGPVLLWRPVGTGTAVGGAVVMRANTDTATGDIAAGWAVVLAGAVLAAATFAALAFALARWMLRPVQELAAGVNEVTAGRAGAHVSPRAGPPELRELAGAFNVMSDAVRTSAEQQRRLVADTSHQLRNPLAALRLRVDLLGPSVAPAGEQAYRSMVREVDRLETLLDGLLDLASAESSATERIAATSADGSDVADVASVVANRLDVWLPMADRAGVRMHITPGPDVAAACTVSELAQVLDVVLDNAVRYAGRSALVDIAWSVGGRRMCLHVSDDGPGLPDADLPRATERFWRGEHNGLRGSGLGLAIAEQLVRARGGRLTLRRAAEGGLHVAAELPCR